jgi:hypothetical protein
MTNLSCAISTRRDKKQQREKTYAKLAYLIVAIAGIYFSLGILVGSLVG